MLLGTGLCAFLIFLKIFMFNESNFAYLLWNLFLAWVPLAIALSIRKIKNRVTQALVVLLWLAFLPNSPYLITDLIHLNERHISANWSDAMILFIAALTGLSAGIVSLRMVHQWLRSQAGNSISQLAMAAIFILTGYGIFMGRIQRWNSWDLATRPMAVISDGLAHVNNPQAIYITATFSCFMAIVYYTANESYEKRNEPN